MTKQGLATFYASPKRLFTDLDPINVLRQQMAQKLLNQLFLARS